MYNEHDDDNMLDLDAAEDVALLDLDTDDDAADDYDGDEITRGWSEGFYGDGEDLSDL